ncbi:MAG TPA: carbohydrate ABC transporter permease [Roseiflexaceae bacterium]|nr:carbohydrate ABC transporter permease [Roseiflexaceae bacterium]
MARPYSLETARDNQAQTQRGQRRSLRRRLLPAARHALLIGVSIAFLAPFYWMIVSSLKQNNQIFTLPIQWVPNPPRWENYSKAINYPNFPFLRFLGNSLFYSISVTIGTVISCAAVGYGFARMRFPGRDLLFFLTLSTMMIPGIVTFIPTFVLFKSLGMLGTYTPLILPNFLGNAFFIFMMRQFYLGLPWELSDSARVDGAGEFRIFWQIMLPLVRSALMVVAVFTFLYTWHDFFGPLIYLSERSQYPLSLGLYAFRAQRTTEWALMMAASTLTMLPLVIVFFFTQRYFLEGITLTGIKG